MGSDDKEFPKAFGSHTSSSAINTTEEKGQKNDTTKGRKRLHEFLKSCPKKELVRSSLDKEKKQGQLSKCKLTEELSKATGSKVRKNLELKKLLNHSTPINNQTPHRKQPRKGENPIRIPPSNEVCSDVGCTRTWICKNSACKAILTAEETFCKRCSCCICHLFDDNKDPSLWLVCTSESGDCDWCGMSCHIECALQRQKTGVVDLGQFMQLDGNYCCASCGKVSGIIGCWKKQLAIAKDARRVDVLCYRIFLSYKLLDGTSKFKEMHKIVEDAKAKLETEIGPLSGVSSKMARGIVSRLSVASDVQKLCSLGVEKADEWLSSTSQSDLKHKDSRPAACKFLFEEITSTTLVIVLKDTSSSSSDAIKGYKLWYCKSTEKPNSKEPVIFPKAQRRILVTNLQPCTEYTFRIISFTDDGDLGHSESKCFTESVEIIHNHSKHGRAERCSSSEKKESKPTIAGSSTFEVRKLGKILRLTWEQGEDCYSDLYRHNIEEESCDGSGLMKPETVEEDAEPVGACRLDLNLVSVPDLNAEITPPIENTPDEENGCSSQNNQVPRSDGSGDSEMCAVSPVREIPVIESGPLCRKRSPMENEENYDGDSTLVNCSPLRFSNGSGRLDDSYEYCVKVVRWLECSGHIEKEFRMKFLTWFSLRSTEQERRVVVTFIRTLIEDPNCLADQLLDSFSEIVTCKRPRNGFCSMLWH